MKANIKAPFKSRTFKVGGYSAMASIVVAAIALLVILLVNKIPSSYTKLDLTSSQLYSISDETKDFLSGLEEEVTIYWVVQSGQEDSTLEQVLENYETVSYTHLDVYKRQAWK